jgi:hypothetical protein
MKKCTISSGTLVDYIYGEIDDVSKLHEIELHIKSCPDCLMEIGRLEAVKKAAEANRVDFPEEIWSVQRQNILRKIRTDAPAKKSFGGIFHGIFDVKKLSLAALIIIMAGIGTQYYRNVKILDEQKAMADKMELLQNMEIIERLDFYEKMSLK